MRRLISTIVLLAAVSTAAAGQTLYRGTITEGSVRSAILGEEVKYNVYLPSGYDKQTDERYPVVYLLHGLYGIHSDWATLGHMKDVVDELIMSGECRKVIIITPDAGDPDIHNQWNGYFNMPGHNYEDFFFQEFLPTVESRYRIIADKQHRAVMGLSMGGGGSTVYCQRHPELFSSCYAMSAWLDEEAPTADDPVDKLWYVRKAVREHSALDFLRNADEATLEKLRTVKWFYDIGDDDYLLELSMKMYMLHREKDVKAELRVRDGWHGWEYWHTALRLSLPFASRNFAE